jgi:hypothetical protein
VRPLVGVILLIVLWHAFPDPTKMIVYAVLVAMALVAALVVAALARLAGLLRRVVRWSRAGVRAPAAGRPVDWSASRVKFDALRAEYAGYECNPLAVLRLPALADVTVSSTARFVDAFAKAQALHTDQQPPSAMVEEYQRAVDAAWRAWQAAKDAAERIRLAGLSPKERASVQRVIKLLTLAERTGHDAERHAAYAKAREELATLDRAGLLRLPTPALATLDEASRASLSQADQPTQAR